MKSNGKRTAKRTDLQTRQILTRFRAKFPAAFIELTEWMQMLVSVNSFDPEMVWHWLGEPIDLREWGYDRAAYVITRDLLRFADEVAEPSLANTVIGRVSNLVVGDFRPRELARVGK